jgi:uncharacterized membrane protein
MKLDAAIAWILRIGCLCSCILIVLGLLIHSTNTIVAGLLLLLITPIARVLWCFIIFIYLRNPLYVLLTVGVIINLLIGIFLLPEIIL